jgi:hypothetical protein
MKHDGIQNFVARGEDEMLARIDATIKALRERAAILILQFYHGGCDGG